MPNYIEVYSVWKDTQPAGSWHIAPANFAEDDPRVVTEGLVTRDGIDVTPDQVTLDSAWSAYESDPDTIIENNLQSAKQSILVLADKARAHADKIGLVFEAVVTAQETGETADQTFTRITDALNDAIVSNGFRTLVMTAFVAQGGTQFDFANLGAVSATNRARFNLFACQFALTWTFMVSLTKS